MTPKEDTFDFDTETMRGSLFTFLLIYVKGESVTIPQRNH
jgi:hypothetical protein